MQINKETVLALKARMEGNCFNELQQKINDVKRQGRRHYDEIVAAEKALAERKFSAKECLQMFGL